MKIIVDISEEDYRYFTAFWLMGVNENRKTDILINAIKNGTPLPKEHGRLIDAGALIEHIENLPKCPNGYSEMYDEAMIINIINKESTILETCKED